MLPFVSSARRRQLRFLRTSLGWRGCALWLWAKLTGREILFRPNHGGAQASWALRIPSTDVYVHNQVFCQHQYRFSIARPPRVIVDIGANIGLFAIYMAERFPAARIYALEPESRNFARLKANTVAFPQITAIQAALWHESTEVQVVDPGIGHWGFATENAPDGALGEASSAALQSVAALTVDALMAREQIAFIDILKIDIEGAEKEVLTDTSRWIDQIDTLVIELHEQFRPGTLRAYYNGTQGFAHEWRQGENYCLSRGGCVQMPPPPPVKRHVDFT